ncbi:hypothetical protein [Nannocystis bainbridge]|uniref:Uncharacterized protein n=1 Tax=Nannocystis bainbridge TaxID=2995303 RepID=A0ABT5E2X3_9BACT|nr:hypothetical protein [Nannocystis bainbridge]MDC0719750.1 hypothetical protein [Nannocystis bainbridge]
MRRASCLCSLAALVALAPTTATAGLRPCRLPVRSAAAGKPCQDPGPAPVVAEQYPQPRGLKSLIVGASLFAFGIPTTIVGTLLVMNPQDPPPGPAPQGPYAGLHFLIPGALMLLVGMPLTAIGAVRYERFTRSREDWTAKIRVKPTGGGFALQF